MVISEICTNCRSEILGEFLGVNVPFPAREGGCPLPVAVCKKTSLSPDVPARYLTLRTGSNSELQPSHKLNGLSFETEEYWSDTHATLPT